jgi:hypothetical protein
MHRFQGLSAGQTDEGKIPNATPIIVCDPDNSIVEGRATGFFYTMLSRATTFGDDDGLNSAIYFTGPNLTRERVQNLTLKSNTKATLVNVLRRTEWVSHLEQNLVDHSHVTKEMIEKMVSWAKEEVSYDALYKRCQQYAAVVRTGYTRPTIHVSDS